MNPERVRDRGLEFSAVRGARLMGYTLTFNKRSNAGGGHANIVYAPGSVVEGLLYDLEGPQEIIKMDPYEKTPVNYGRDAVRVQTDVESIWAWTYFGNAAVLETGLKPPREYLDHLLAGEEWLSREYFETLRRWQTLGV